MTRSDAIPAAIEHRHAQAVGADAYIELKRLFRQIVQRQRAWRDTIGDQDAGEPAER